MSQDQNETTEQKEAVKKPFDLTDAIRKQIELNPDDCFLTHTQRVKKFTNCEIKDTLKLCYKPDRAAMPFAATNSKLLGTLLNAIFTQSKLVFMIGRNDFAKLVRHDNNVKRVSLEPEEWTIFMRFLLTNRWVSIVKEPTGSRMGVYKIENIGVRNIIGQLVTDTIEESQMKQCLEKYEEKMIEKPKSNSKS
jgi:hypothetical protein